MLLRNMFAPSTASKLAALTLTRTTPAAGIVYQYTPRRSPFDKTQYREDYVPRPNKYHPKRKPRLAQWDDPDYVWPRLMPRSFKGKYPTLLQEINQEERQKIDASREFLIPDFRSGDVVQFNFLHSITSGKGNVFTGIVMKRKKQNSLSSNFSVIFRAAGVEVLMNIKQCSPLLKDLKLVERGSGDLRYNLSYLWNHRTLSAEQTRRPILKKSRAKRNDDVVASTRKSTLSLLGTGE